MAKPKNGASAGKAPKKAARKTAPATKADVSTAEEQETVDNPPKASSIIRNDW